MNPIKWPFADPPNVAVITDQRILDGSSWISRVYHDAEDGGWQFHGPDAFADEANAMIVGLKTIFELDASIGELADLPLGWRAWRVLRAAAWERGPQESQ